MKSAAVALQCSDAGAPEVEQHFYQISFRAQYSKTADFSNHENDIHFSLFFYKGILFLA